ncbi:HotDog domain-containing protein [Mycena polygramma]|nr:HotDog domain-containing protein [Mycena polygramma]
MTNWDSWQRSLPKAPHIDATQIRGNISGAEKQLCANVFAFYTTGSGISRISESFGSEIAGRLRIVELNVRDDASTGIAESEMVTEIEVTENMCNVFSTMHGGCAAFLLDPTTLFAMVLLGRAKGFDGAGVSTSMNVSWHNPAPLGSRLIITTCSVYHDGRARLARCEMRDQGTGKLIVSGTHALVNSERLRKKAMKL